MNFNLPNGKVLVVAVVEQYRNVRDELAAAGIWTDRDDNQILIEQMDLGYVLNLLSYLGRKAKKATAYVNLTPKALLANEPAYPHLMKRLAVLDKQGRIIEEEWELTTGAEW